MSKFQFQWPEIKYSRTNTLPEQLAHLATECREVAEKIEQEDYIGVFEEIMDLLHSAESALRIAERVHGINLDEYKAAVIKKNDARGYYDVGGDVA